MGQRMSGQNVLCFEQRDQSRQSGLRDEVLFSRCVLFKPSPPILLPLTAHPLKPLAQGDLPEQAQENRKPDHLKTPIIELGPQRMDRTTVGTTIPLYPQPLRTLIKMSIHIPMTPQPWTPAPWTPRRTRPRILLSHLLQQLDIQIAIQYQVRSLWGITENTTPATECILGYPFPFPSTYSEKKKDLYNKR
jgi:hypothetical protein